MNFINPLKQSSRTLYVIEYCELFHTNDGHGLYVTETLIEQSTDRKSIVFCRKYFFDCLKWNSVSVCSISRMWMFYVDDWF